MSADVFLLALVAGLVASRPPVKRKACSVLCVTVPERQLAAMLASGEGPCLPTQARCPDCDGALRCWPGYSRLIRHRGHTQRLLVHRARCKSCGHTHALLPSFLAAYRRDVVPVIGRALLRAARGSGHRPLAKQAGIPAQTVRGWLRRARRASGHTRRPLVIFAYELGVDPGRPSTRGDPSLSALLHQIATIHAGAVERRFLAPEDCPYGLANALTRGWLLGPPRAA